MFREAEVFTLSGLSVHFDRNTHLGHMRPETTALYTRLTQTVEINSHQVINHLMNHLGLEGNNHDPR